jgi:hypothetical protein
MGGMRYNVTLAVLKRALHDHVERCMKTEDFASKFMKNDLSRAMQEFVYLLTAGMALHL